ncbi:MAG: signal peptidase I, partial [Firmicutes bacterium]|nr:signal peptidase I [Bacillota bacterium]
FIYRLQEPERNDIVVFRYSPNRDFIKRVVALEGDKFEIRQGNIYVNDNIVEESGHFDNGLEDYGPVVVPSGHIFVLGDNRANSMDSRDSSVGFVDVREIKGKAFFVFWPLSEFRFLS